MQLQQLQRVDACPSFRFIPNITASKKEHEIITTNADELLVLKKEIIVKPRKTENKIREGQKAYLKKDLDPAELKFLTTSGFKEVKEKSISGKNEIYLVIEDKNESPSHIICIKEIADYLKQFTQDIQTYRTVKPDIVFVVGGYGSSNTNNLYFIANEKTGGLPEFSWQCCYLASP